MCNALFLYIDNAAGSESSLACIGYLINDCNDLYGLDMQFDACFGNRVRCFWVAN